MFRIDSIIDRTSFEMPRKEGKRSERACTKKYTRTGHAHTSDAGLGSSSNRISGAAYTAGVWSYGLIPGLHTEVA
jgi:hypothetical protein